MNQSTEVLRVEVLGQSNIVVKHHMPNDTYTVQYGLQFKQFNTLVQAVAEYESCVVHALTCSGWEV